MTQIEVKLVDSMGDDLRVANAARVSFSKWKEELDEGDVGLINYLARHEHFSPFRHTAITLRCKAPVFLARQLGKHQVGLSWNEVSRRYVDAGVEFFVPDYWRSRPDGSVKQGSGDVHSDNAMFRSIYAEFSKNALATYENMIACGVAPEMARMVLPQSMMVDWVWTGSLTAFFHIWRLRIDNHAQLEAQEFAQRLEETIQPIFPHSWKALKNA
ncbi:thymidylate synthase [Pseudomonas phage IME180]|nr:thymidylate synthase [Pseudomonas phage IME180]